MKTALFILFTFIFAFGGINGQTVSEIKTHKMGPKPMCTNQTGDTLYMGFKKNLYIYHVPTGRLIKRVPVNAGNITDIQNVAGRNTLFVATRSMFGGSELLQISRSTQEKITTTTFKKPIRAFCVSPNEEKYAVSCDKQIHILTMDQNDYDTSLATGFHTLALAFNENGHRLAYGGSNKRVIYLDLLSWNEIGSVGHQNWVRKIVFTHTNNSMISAGDDRSIYFSDLTKPDMPSKILSGHKNRIYDMLVSPDDHYLISVSTDRTYIIWDAGNKNLLERYKTKPAAGISDVSLAYDFKQLLLSPVTRKDLPVIDVAYLKIAPNIQIQKNAEDKDPPQIYVSSPEKIDREKITTYEDPFPIKGTVLDEYGLRKVMINGQEIAIRENGNFVQFLPLAFGDNPVTIEAMDVNGNIALKKFILSRKSGTGTSEVAGPSRNFLLVVGINQYQHWPELNNAVNDAKSVEQVLLNKYQFEQAETTVLLNGDATRNNIYQAMRKYIELVGPNDNLLIYYAGHGYFDELLNEGYWVPVEAHLGQDAEYLPNSTILKIIGNINSKHTFLVADACFSGSLFAERERGYTENVEKYKSRWGLASGRLEEVSDGTGKHSPFASSFVDILNNTDQEKITASEVIQYVKKEVAEVAKQTPRGNPLKNVGDEGGEFVFKKRASDE